MDSTELSSEPNTSRSCDFGDGLQVSSDTDIFRIGEYGDVEETSVSEESVQLEGQIEEVRNDNEEEERGKRQENETGVLPYLGVLSLLIFCRGFLGLRWLCGPSSLIEEDDAVAVMGAAKGGKAFAAGAWGGGGSSTSVGEAVTAIP